MAIPNLRVRTYALLRRLPLSFDLFGRSFQSQILARLACLIHAANVHSEPGSNPSKICLNCNPNQPDESGRPKHSYKTKKSVIPVCRPGQRAANQFLLAKTHRLTISIWLSKISLMGTRCKQQCSHQVLWFLRGGGSLSRVWQLSIAMPAEVGI